MSSIEFPGHISWYSVYKRNSTAITVACILGLGLVLMI